MACAAVLVHFDHSTNGKREVTLTELLGIEEQEPLTLEYLVNNIHSIKEGDRDQLVSILNYDTKDYIGTEEIQEIIKVISEKNNVHISGNTSVVDIFQTYPKLSDIYESEVIEMKKSNHALIRTNRFKNGDISITGRATLPNGQNIFILSDYNSIISYLNYLSASIRVEKDLNSKESVIAAQESSLKEIREEYSIKDNKELFDIYLNHRSILKPFALDNGDIITPRKIIQPILAKILGKVDYTEDYTDLEISLSNINKNTKSDSFDWILNMEEMYELLTTFYPKLKDETSLETFKGMSIDRLKVLLYHPEKGLFVGHAKLMKTEIDSINVKKGSQSITLHFPGRKAIADMVNVGGDTKSIFIPYSKDSDSTVQDGKYNGMTIYKATVTEYNGKKKEVFAISRHPLSLASNMSTYNSIESAKKAIDKKWNSEPIYKNALIDIKLNKEMGVTTIQSSGLELGQTISVLDIDIPGIYLHNVGGYAMNLLEMSMSEFHEVFKSVEGIKQIDTSEKAATFIYKAFLDEDSRIRLSGNNGANIDITNENISEALINEENKSRISTIIDDISKATERHYRVVDITYRHKKGWVKAFIQEVEPSTVISIQGEPKVERPTTLDIKKNITELAERYGVEVKVLNEDGIKEVLGNEYKEGSIVKAFIKEGKIYINEIHAEVSDFYHEMSHLALGILKVDDYERYETLMKSYKERPRFKTMYNTVESRYKGYARTDIEEEALVELIAEDIVNGRSDFSIFVETLIKQVKTTRIDQASDIGYDGVLRDLIQGRSSDLEKRRILTNLIKNKIESNEIIEKCK